MGPLGVPQSSSTSLLTNTLPNVSRSPVDTHPQTGNYLQLQLMKTVHHNLLAACIFGLSLLSPSLSLSAPDRFARFSTHPVRIFAGQTFDLTLSLYNTGETLDQAVNISDMPPTGTFHCSPFQELALQQETVDSRTYEIRRFRSHAIAPTSGSIILSPSLQGNIIREQRSYFFVQRLSSSTQIPVEPLTLTVFPLPTEGRPYNFSGAVGEFQLSAKAFPLDIAVGDLITIETRIEGIGLPENLPAPSLPRANGITVYPAKYIPSESTATSRVFRQTVVPLEPSLSKLPAITFTFFNTLTCKYETQTTDPFPVTFHAEKAPVQSVYTPNTSTSNISSPKPTALTSSLWKRILSYVNPATDEQLNITQDTKVHLAPSEGAMVLFQLKRGVSVTVESRSEDWIRIESAEGTGWIHKR